MGSFIEINDTLQITTEQQFEAAVDGLSFTAMKALHAIQVRDGIEDRDEFRHVVNISGEELDGALEELIELGLVEENEGTWGMTPSFQDYWKKSAKKEG